MSDQCYRVVMCILKIVFVAMMVVEIAYIDKELNSMNEICNEIQINLEKQTEVIQKLSIIEKNNLITY